MVVFLLIILALKIKMVVSDKGVCSAGPPKFPDDCCTNYRLNGDKCIECVGFYGRYCAQERPVGFYGKSCNEACNCTKKEICNPYVGCFYEFNTSVSDPQQTVHQKDNTYIWNIIVGIIALNVLCCILHIIVFSLRKRRQRHYEVKKIMETIMATNQLNQAKELQMIRYKDLKEDCCKLSIKNTNEHEYSTEHGKYMLNNYNRIVFPKFQTVDIPADQYSIAIVSNVTVDEEIKGSICTTGKVERKDFLRHSSSNQHIERNSRPYSLMHPYEIIHCPE